MPTLPSCWLRALPRLLALLIAAWLAPAQAHLMVAQKGTLNFSGDGAYLLVSLPVSALSGVDDDADGRLSLAELRAHAGDIERQLKARVQLLHQGRPLALQGLMLNLSPPDDTPGAPAHQLVAMGRFALASADPQALEFRLDLFGRAADEQVHDITFTRAPPDQAQRQAARYTAAQARHPVFPSAGRVFVDQLRAGFRHVMDGADHLLFLLVVLASMARTPPGWRGALLILSCFTAGHACTLVASVWGGWSVAPAVVEPAIAATIVVMALLDLGSRRRAPGHGGGGRPVWVFGCALVHGLGLAGGLGGLGLTGANLAWSLAGFNLGIELAQLSVVAAAVAATRLMGRLIPLAGPSRAVDLSRMAPVASVAASLVAIVMGAWWFVERTAASI